MKVRTVQNTLMNFEPRNKLKLNIKFRSVGTGKYHPDTWILYHHDKTTINDATDEHIINNFNTEFKNYCVGSVNAKFHQVPGGACKALHLYKWKTLQRSNATAITYTQKMTQDLCISKAFASTLCNAGFVDQAECIESKCFNKESCFDAKNPNMMAI